MDIKDLIERLRTCASVNGGGACHDGESADALERLQAENERLELRLSVCRKSDDDIIRLERERDEALLRAKAAEDVAIDIAGDGMALVDSTPVKKMIEKRMAELREKL